ncbi:MAG: aminotransferase class V-fold PLP-dependent enzyme [Oscillospiraceae bacterium]|nr:aminotransferase class V-fold PLP-dependent enzyme [Oscillospiraceae bacterium]
MYSFLNDYSETAHPAVLQALVDTNMEQCVGYGADEHCQRAAALMKAKMKADNVEIHFIPGGTQTNTIAAAAFLRPIEAIISAETGHIHGHECASIEETGHKILAELTEDGKLTVAHLEHARKLNQEEYCPIPKMVYISNSTELGTVYSKAELEELYAYCKTHDMILFIDGARMGSALACTDLTFEDYPKLCDAFYVGGTKNGALLGEAMVIVNDQLKFGFRQHMKQRGAMLAKGKVLGVQFETLFDGDLFMELAEHANDCMNILRDGIADLGYKFLCDSPSNQIFPIFPVAVLEKLNEKYAVLDYQDMGDGSHCVRMVTSWATDKEQCRNFVEDLKNLTK